MPADYKKIILDTTETPYHGITLSMIRVPIFSETADSASVSRSSRKSLESETIIFKPEDNFCGINGSNSIKV